VIGPLEYLTRGQHNNLEDFDARVEKLDLDEMVSPRRFVPAQTTGKRSICTVLGTKLLLEGMRDRLNLFPSFSCYNRVDTGDTKALLAID
jgi:hypothetical protein